MLIKCKATKRFLGKVDTTTLFDTIQKMTGINANIPVRVEFTCKRCGMNEIYDVYKDTYVHVESYKNKR